MSVLRRKVFHKRYFLLSDESFEAVSFLKPKVSVPLLISLFVGLNTGVVSIESSVFVLLVQAANRKTAVHKIKRQVFIVDIFLMTVGNKIRNRQSSAPDFTI